MKKTIALLITFALLITLCACADKSTKVVDVPVPNNLGDISLSTADGSIITMTDQDFFTKVSDNVVSVESKYKNNPCALKTRVKSIDSDYIIVNSNINKYNPDFMIFFDDVNDVIDLSPGTIIKIQGILTYPSMLRIDNATIIK